MLSEDLAAAKSALVALGNQRVWSLMFTLFGDLAQGESDVIEGPVLSAVMAGLDIRPEAARVALHRLRNDGWIHSAKHGRISRHSLTAKARTISAAASPRIYAPPQGDCDRWQCVMTQNAGPDDIAKMGKLGFVALMPRIFVGPMDARPPKSTLVFAGGAVPDWLREQLRAEDLSAEYALLHNALARLRDSLGDGSTSLRPLDVAVLRCLIVHNWRRLVLKRPPLPTALQHPDAAEHRCHLVVADLLARLPRPALHDLAPRS